MFYIKNISKYKIKKQQKQWQLVAICLNSLAKSYFTYVH